MNTSKIIYWTATILVLLSVGLGGIPDLLKIDALKESFRRIGFPEYYLPFFGVLKILGAITIVVPALRRLREGAYAGMMFYFLGATYAHVAVGDRPDKYGITLFILASIVVSYIYSLQTQSHEKAS